MRVEPALGQIGPRHNFGQTDALDSVLAYRRGGNLKNLLSGVCLVIAAVPHLPAPNRLDRPRERLGEMSLSVEQCRELAKSQY
jgi:hypothetical protein